MTLNDNPNQCASCGVVYPHEIRYHSGSRECQSCWYWRKIGYSAAQYWNDQINQLFDDGKGSRIDANDFDLWRHWGWGKAVAEALDTLEALRQRYEILLNCDTETRVSIMERID